ncbi:hypothetical protein ACFGVR_10765 [Mucilaginibacter sp. AW1-3]
MKRKLFLLPLLILLLGYKAFSQVIVPGNYSVITNAGNKKAGSLYGASEAIYGNFKQVITVRQFKISGKKTVIKYNSLIDTINYDQAGNIINSLVDIYFTNFSCIYSKYFSKYDWLSLVARGDKYHTIRKLRSYNADSIVIGQFDNYGDDIGGVRVSCPFRNDSAAYTYDVKQHYVKQILFHHDQYLPGLKEIYKYNAQRFQTEIDDYSITDKLEEKVMFVYKVFDTHGNWTKRTETRKNAKGITTGIVTTTRKITYY